MRYTLEEYSKISFENNNYKLPEEVVNKIQFLIKELKININQIQDEVENKNIRNRYVPRQLKYVLSNSIEEKINNRIEESWKTNIQFKTTNIEKKEGIEKTINDIRISLNKISIKNYEQQRDLIFFLIKELLKDEHQHENQDEKKNIIIEEEKKEEKKEKKKEEKKKEEKKEEKKNEKKEEKIIINSFELLCQEDEDDDEQINEQDDEKNNEKENEQENNKQENNEQNIEKENEQNNNKKDEEENIKKIAQCIFDIASSNKFYSELYAKLYKELIKEYDIFYSFIVNLIEEYKENINNIKFVDSNKDYENYCENNKLNDKRKALITFIANLMKEEILSKSEVFNLILYLQEKIMLQIDEDEKTYQVDEITENIFILITLVVNEFENITNIEKNKELNNIKENITICSNYKSKEHKSISSRAIFKYMDMKELIKNKEQK
jgi:hypothetical protein